jgi:hypothetical protein
MNKDNLRRIINDVKDISDELLINVDGNTILMVSAKLLMSEQIQSDKGFKPANQIDDAPTEKQRIIIQKAGMRIPEGTTRKSASELVKEIFSKQK